jgi:hypothetical protein
VGEYTGSLAVWLDKNKEGILTARCLYTLYVMYGVVTFI